MTATQSIVGTESLWSSHPTSTTFILNHDSTLEYVFVVSGPLEPCDVVIKLEKPWAVFRCVGLLLGTEKSIQSWSLRVVHEAPHTTSHVTIHAIGRDTSSQTFNAMVRIERGAAGADASVQMRSLLLSPHAHAHPVPSFEIEEADVKAKHASSVGRPCAQELFYLQTRGLPLKSATDLIVQGFQGHLLNLIHDPALKTRLRNALHLV